jgi:hypothetical protein
MLWLGVVFVLIVPTTIGLITTNSAIALVAAACAFVAVMSRFDSLTELSMGPLKATIAAQNIAAARAAVITLPDSPSKEVIITTTNAAMEAVTTTPALCRGPAASRYHATGSRALDEGIG